MAALAEAGIVVLTHAGAGGDAAADARGAPQQLRSLAAAVPTLQLIACHYGGYHRLDEAEDVIVGTNVWLETSWPPTLGDLDPARIRGIIEKHGADRVVFGSDWPMTDPAAEIAAVRNLGLDADDEAGVLGGNLARLLKLDTCMRTVRLGAGMAFWGDRVQPAIDMAERGGHRLPVLRPPGRAHHVDPRQADAARPVVRLDPDVLDLLRGALAPAWTRASRLSRTPAAPTRARAASGSPSSARSSDSTTSASPSSPATTFAATSIG